MAIIAPANGPAYLAAVVRYKACYFSRAWSPSAVPLPSLLPDPQAAGKADGGSFVGANRGGSAGGGAGAGAASGAAAGTGAAGAAGAAPQQDGGSGGGAGSAPSVEGDLALHFLCMLQREDPKCLPVQFVPLEVFPLLYRALLPNRCCVEYVRTMMHACPRTWR